MVRFKQKIQGIIIKEFFCVIKKTLKIQKLRNLDQQDFKLSSEKTFD